MSTRSASLRRLPVLLASLLFCNGATAQWRVVEPAGDNAAPRAQIRNDSGAELAIYRDDNDNVHAEFRLPDRLHAFDTDICPTYHINRRDPRNSGAAGATCDMQALTSHYPLGRIEANRIVSRPLYEFMNGTHIDFRYRLANGDYAETRFSLMGSKRILSNVLGGTLEVLPR